eukprot:Amastigsp_a842004_297.p2 type:complete len:239 gc:universal Amastigsp_a842004_297:746-30(-)
MLADLVHERLEHRLAAFRCQLNKGPKVVCREPCVHLEHGDGARAREDGDGQIRCARVLLCKVEVQQRSAVYEPCRAAAHKVTHRNARIDQSQRRRVDGCSADPTVSLQDLDVDVDLGARKQLHLDDGLERGLDEQRELVGAAVAFCAALSLPRCERGHGELGVENRRVLACAGLENNLARAVHRGDDLCVALLEIRRAVGLRENVHLCAELAQLLRAPPVEAQTFCGHKLASRHERGS